MAHGMHCLHSGAGAHLPIHSHSAEFCRNVLLVSQPLGGAQHYCFAAHQVRQQSLLCTSVAASPCRCHPSLLASQPPRSAPRPICHLNNLDSEEDNVIVFLDEQEGISKDEIPPWDDPEAGSSDDEEGENNPPVKQ